MILYQFLIPVRQNNGNSYVQARKDFEEAMTAEAGGYTEMPLVDGVYIDPKTKRRYDDKMAMYQVATDTEVGWKLIKLMKELFPDQTSFLVAEIGSADLITGQNLQ